MRRIIKKENKIKYITGSFVEEIIIVDLNIRIIKKRDKIYLVS